MLFAILVLVLGFPALTLGVRQDFRAGRRVASVVVLMVGLLAVTISQTTGPSHSTFLETERDMLRFDALVAGALALLAVVTGKVLSRFTPQQTLSVLLTISVGSYWIILNQSTLLVACPQLSLPSFLTHCAVGRWNLDLGLAEHVALLVLVVGAAVSTFSTRRRAVAR